MPRRQLERSSNTQLIRGAPVGLQRARTQRVSRAPRVSADNWITCAPNKAQASPRRRGQSVEDAARPAARHANGNPTARTCPLRGCVSEILHSFRFPEGGGRSIRLIEEDKDLCTATFMGIFITTSEPAHPGIDGTLFAAPGSRLSVSTPRQPSHTRVERSHAERASSLALPSLWINVPGIRTPGSGMNQLCPLDMEQTPRRQACAPVARLCSRVGSDGILVKPYESATHVSVPRSSVDHRGVSMLSFNVVPGGSA
ncbi:hypothetical protein VTO73DRAFT_3815 [Trametes versicolor]